MKKLTFLILFLTAIACQKKEQTEKTTVVTDEHSYSKPELAVVKHLDLDIKVDFDTQTISGKASWTIDNISKGNEIIFDENTLNITKVTLGDDEKETKFELGKDVEFHGKPLHVTIEPNTTKVNIYYSTTKDAVALQWLTPAQTADKKKPFLFSQGESVWSRTWIPCQDSPGIRFTYNAKVTVPKDLLAVMSAVNPQKKNDTGVYTFKQDKAIPSYLMAIAVGDIEFQAIDNRTGVYAEPSMLKKSAWEFAELGKMVVAAEKLYGPYRWGRYDVLVLPPSFPYGGMENPNLTFLTPGVIAGDRSLTSLLAHELGHSWSGNLVTNATWDDIWLNEGFTTYVEHRIGEAIFGKKEFEMQNVITRKELVDNVAEYGDTNPDTRLKVSLTGRNPDDGISMIPYVKGYAFLRVIEDAVGREKFDIFIKNYFDAHAFKSITTEDFVKYINENLIKGDKALADKIKLEDWIYKPGIPSNITPVSSADFDAIDAIQKSWRETGVAGLSKKITTTAEKQHFIDHLPDDITAKEMEAIDKEFNFTNGGNFIIKRQWFVQAIRHQYKAANPAIEQFLIGSSRTGSVMMLYKEMAKTPEGKTWAKQIFDKAKSGYHATTIQAFESVVK
ncbi:hydrolase/aminopeptidase [Flavobacterium johnsoniae]|uniref:Aminopeptidase N n=1 Tax=Flavobacterium johnsoniae (strain ATCC 17061 / DSM 2064 / JCM 8514 / BCRC 14874 / CCUG 350202 / NBRC 14942 / NCIMB 11054 / UW101) TaxID=376686 RepID=A5FJN6_FLAJ1|nr:hydrolase/aminopeptidase [Flavobacterium johnsoniae]ABQ04583.1 peptidase family M1, membrane alanine aminopeptidase [Flavobacterium johnsoniae UW101]OXE97905.1 aminopeptidase [Flavobacterium johnsoniae UW101]WQG83621.1 leukotriene A4 hydrolase C-terminal domain-containing protein [Flavobacterium johnsoniae UW101]SHK26893.1 Leukotriene A4 hydrolase, C-terminal [Flavobacterium johnsoniae]